MLLLLLLSYNNRLPRWRISKELPANGRDAGDTGLIPGSGRSPVQEDPPGEGNGNLFQYSYLENPMDRGAWWATVHEVAKSWTWLSTWAHTITKHIFFTYSGYEPYQIHDLQIFSIHRSCLFIPLIMFLWGTQVFNFDTVQTVLFFTFVACAFGVISRKPLSNLMSWSFPPMLFSNNLYSSRSHV